MGISMWDAKGYLVEYGDALLGDSGGVSTAFASDSGTLEGVYTATVNTRIDGALAAAPGIIELRQGEIMVATPAGGSGLMAVDMSDPEAPQEKGMIKLGGFQYGVESPRRHAY